MELTREEKWMLLEAIDKQIAYRLKNETRRSEVHPLRRLKRKIELIEPTKSTK